MSAKPADEPATNQKQEELRDTPPSGTRYGREGGVEWQDFKDAFEHAFREDVKVIYATYNQRAWETEYVIVLHTGEQLKVDHTEVRNLNPYDLAVYLGDRVHQAKEAAELARQSALPRGFRIGTRNSKRNKRLP